MRVRWLHVCGRIGREGGADTLHVYRKGRCWADEGSTVQYLCDGPLLSVRTLYNLDINGRWDSGCLLCGTKEADSSVWRITYTDFSICFPWQDSWLGWRNISGRPRASIKRRLSSYKSVPRPSSGMKQNLGSRAEWQYKWQYKFLQAGPTNQRELLPLWTDWSHR